MNIKFLPFYSSLADIFRSACVFVFVCVFKITYRKALAQVYVYVCVCLCVCVCVCVCVCMVVHECESEITSYFLQYYEYWEDAEISSPSRFNICQNAATFIPNQNKYS